MNVQSLPIITLHTGLQIKAIKLDTDWRIMKRYLRIYSDKEISKQTARKRGRNA